MNNTQKIPNMATIKEVVEAYKLSEYIVRKMCRSREGKQFTVTIGKKYLINLEKFNAFLSCEMQSTGIADSGKTFGGITPISI